MEKCPRGIEPTHCKLVPRNLKCIAKAPVVQPPRAKILHLLVEPVRKEVHRRHTPEFVAHLPKNLWTQLEWLSGFRDNQSARVFFLPGMRCASKKIPLRCSWTNALAMWEFIDVKRDPLRHVHTVGVESD